MRGLRAMSDNGLHPLGRAMRATIEALELILGAILALMIVLSSVKVFLLVIETEKGFGLPTKTDILEILDLILLLILSIDILRTLFTAISKRVLPIRIVIEAAVLAILREIIAVEVRHLDWKMVLSLSIAFLVLVVAWMALGVLQKRGEIELSPSL